jgi:thioredoxin-like negative regulator of GroEL
MKELSIDELGQEMKSEKPVLVMFYAMWCGFCRRFAPLFSHAERNASVPLARVDIDQDGGSLWDTFQIEAVPTLIAFQNGKQVVRKDAGLGSGLKQKDLDDVLAKLGS